MKTITTILILSFSIHTFSQEDVIILFNQTEVTVNDTLHIAVFLNTPQEVEFAVFTSEKLFDARIAKLDSGKTDYEIPLTGILPGKFFLLVDGGSFHEEFEFTVR